MSKRRLLVEHCHQCIWSNGYVCFNTDAMWSEVPPVTPNGPNFNNNCVPRDGMHQKGIPDWCPLPIEPDQSEEDES